MTRNKIILFAAAVAGTVFFADCSPKTGKATTAGSTATASTNAPHYSAEQVAQGQTIYTANCGKCHKLIDPASKSLDKWNAVLPPMIKKAKLSDDQGELVRAYVMSNIKK